MKIAVIGGTGLIGSKVLACLDDEEYEAGPTSPDTGVNALTGEELAEVLDSAPVLIDSRTRPHSRTRP
jgi:aspartate-semialdehyde dehydrogenase